MARALVLDASVMIAVFHEPGRWPALERTFAAGGTWLPAVAIGDLYAGTRSRAESQGLDRLATILARIDRILTPTPAEWARAGRLLAHHIRARGAIEPRDHFNDVLIVTLAARLRGTVVTLNGRHFEHWTAVARARGLDVTVTPATRVLT